jgi:hypothetical protein
MEKDLTTTDSQRCTNGMFSRLISGFSPSHGIDPLVAPLGSNQLVILEQCNYAITCCAFGAGCSNASVALHTSKIVDSQWM